MKFQSRDCSFNCIPNAHENRARVARPFLPRVGDAIHPALREREGSGFETTNTVECMQMYPLGYHIKFCMGKTNTQECTLHIITLIPPNGGGVEHTCTRYDGFSGIPTQCSGALTIWNACNTSILNDGLPD